ncbi:hypothetical protein M422DRAFT_247147 [Sphaerobolus stellatus SS14]|nr:hypothetical protein M422DRAFT_247147 [Sphaerobolus stellatus SS14]
MHKELNTVKGEYTGMVAYWSENGLVGPVILNNCDNEAAAMLGNAELKARASEVSECGGIKLTKLLGQLLRHQDDTRGQQDSYQYFLLEKVGFISNYPDVCNTWFQSHCEAASEIIYYRDLLVDFMALIKDKKTTGALNHLEANCLKGLQDDSTLSELCILAAVSQAIFRGYIEEVRGLGQGNINVLTLRPLHCELAAYMQSIIDDPDLILSPSATFKTAAFRGCIWDCPEILYVIHSLSPKLPHLQGLLVAFLRAAITTWRRFMAEYAPGGIIAEATPEQQLAANMDVTNDANEGILGQLKNTIQRNPSMTELTYNSRTLYRQNNSAEFIASLSQEPKRKKESALHEQHLAKVKREKDRQRDEKQKGEQAYYAAYKPIIHLENIKKLTNPHLDQELAFYRHFDKSLPRSGATKQKPKKLKLLTLLICRHQGEMVNIPLEDAWLGMDDSILMDSEQKKEETGDEGKLTKEGQGEIISPS